MVNVVISGLPRNVKLPKFISYLEKTLFEEHLRVRVVNSSFTDSSLKCITLHMRSNEARKVRRYLDGLAYPYAGREYRLECWSEDGDNYANHRSRDRESIDNMELMHSDTYSHNGEHSQQPTEIQEELERIDLKIDLLKKQRLLIAEENKLLFEKKKLELLQNIGPNDFNKLVSYEKICSRNNPANVSQLLVQSVPKTKKKNPNKLPNFNAPCKIIIAQMEDVISEYMNEDNGDMLMSLIFSTIRKRLVIVLETKVHLSPGEMVDLYRMCYPQGTDTDLLKELTNTITLSCWPKKLSENPESAKESQGITKDGNTDTEATKIDEEIEVKTDVAMELKGEVEDAEPKMNKEVATNDEIQNEETQVDDESKAVLMEQSNEETEINEKSDVDEAPATNEKQVINGEGSLKEVNEAPATKEINGEGSLKELTNIDDVVDMENDFDDWVDDNSKKDVDEEAKI